MLSVVGGGGGEQVASVWDQDEAVIVEGVGVVEAGVALRSWYSDCLHCETLSCLTFPWSSLEFTWS